MVKPAKQNKKKHVVVRQRSVLRWLDAPLLVGKGTSAPEILSQQTAITSTESCEPTKSTWKKKTLSQCQGKDRRPTCTGLRFDWSTFWNHHPEAAGWEPHRSWKPCWKNFRVCDHIKAPLAFFDCQQPWQAKREKPKRLCHSQKHKTFWSHHFF